MSSALARLSGVMVLAVAAAMSFTQTGEARAAPPVCTLWALADVVDRQARVYGAGGTNGCRGGYIATLVEVDLYMDTRWVAGDRVVRCPNSRCGASTRELRIPRGSHSWCTIVRAGMIFANQKNTQTTTHCMVTHG